MKIVRASMEFLDDIVPLFNSYRMFYEQPNDEEGARAFIQARIENGESIIFVAFEGEQAAGFLQLYPTFSSVGMQKAYILNDLFVDPDFRKRGVGIALMNAAFQFGEKEKARYIMLETAPNNYTAKALYEGMGMKVSNEYDSYIKYL
ncbi:GNAT family N-acetyltransferase [Neobacillus dielmonensis]|uniref:GNAT family N-acetyltransferase n=1 Tax=Neobacillus dielmonensis TaxID=1347369 RepID=UPI0005AB76C2|nr:GNAT family N-acetyltransferase [Neobacillus dielmonensis]